jgi:hypothetical protein
MSVCCILSLQTPVTSCEQVPLIYSENERVAFHSVDTEHVLVTSSIKFRLLPSYVGTGREKQTRV